MNTIKGKYLWFYDFFCVLFFSFFFNSCRKNLYSTILFRIFKIILREIIGKKSKSIRESYYIRIDKTNSFPRTRKRSENRGRKTVDAKIIGLFLFRPSVSRYSDAWHLESLLCHAFPSGTGEKKKREGERRKGKSRHFYRGQEAPMILEARKKDRNISINEAKFSKKRIYSIGFNEVRKFCAIFRWIIAGYWNLESCV